MARGLVSPVTEMALADDGGRGHGFSVGSRFTVSFVYKTEAEALKARERMLEAVRGAEVVERWSRR